MYIDNIHMLVNWKIANSKAVLLIYEIYLFG